MNTDKDFTNGSTLVILEHTGVGYGAFSADEQPIQVAIPTFVGKVSGGEALKRVMVRFRVTAADEDAHAFEQMLIVYHGEFIIG